MEFIWKLAELRTPIFSSLFYEMTLFGEETLVIMILCLIYWCVSKRLAYHIGISYCISGLLVQGLKIAFRVPRPWILDTDFKPVKEAIKSATGYSFPSGHTQSATALYGALGLNSKKKIQKIVCCLFILGIGFSRMYLGVHTPKDVITSFLISIGIVYSFHFFLKEEISNWWAGVMLLAAFFLFIYSNTLLVRGIIKLEYANDCFKSAGAAIGFSVGFLIEKNCIRFKTKTTKSYRQVLKFIIGLIIVIIFKIKLGDILGESLTAQAIKYAIIVFWIIAIYPWLFTNHGKLRSMKQKMYSNLFKK